MSSICKEFDLRWVRFLSATLKVTKQMLNLWITTLLTMLNDDINDRAARTVIDKLLLHYFDFLCANESIGTYAELNNFCEYDAKTAVDFVSKVDETSAKLQRLRDGGHNHAINVRVSIAPNQIRCRQLQFIVDEIERINNAQGLGFEPIRFDPFNIESGIGDDILEYYTEHCNQNFSNMQYFRDCASILEFRQFVGDVNDHLDETLDMLIAVSRPWAPDIDTELLCREYEAVIRKVYRDHGNSVSMLDYYDFWGQNLSNLAFTQQSPNLRSFVFLVFSFGFSNSPAEHLVHDGNSTKTIKRNRMSMMLLDALLHILRNGVALCECEPLVEKGIDLWSKLGGLSALGTFKADDVANCLLHVDNFYNATNANLQSSYGRRKARREQKYKRNAILFQSQ